MSRMRFEYLVLNKVEVCSYSEDSDIQSLRSLHSLLKFPFEFQVSCLEALQDLIH